MPKQQDDLEAVRLVVSAIHDFPPEDQERILRWAREKLGLPTTPLTTGATTTFVGERPHEVMMPPKDESTIDTKGSDIKTFVKSKEPRSDKQFSATVAYWYRFMAPKPEQKKTITGDDLQDACRKTDWKRLADPNDVLKKAYQSGYLDRTDHGAYKINTVGENLVAMTLPASVGARQPSQKTVKRTGKLGRKVVAEPVKSNISSRKKKKK